MSLITKLSISLKKKTKLSIYYLSLGQTSQQKEKKKFKATLPAKKKMVGRGLLSTDVFFATSSTLLDSLWLFFEGIVIQYIEVRLCFLPVMRPSRPAASEWKGFL